MKRRERTRQLIELGGLVQKAGLIELTDDDRAVLLGAFLGIAAKLRGVEREQALICGGGAVAAPSNQNDANTGCRPTPPLLVYPSCAPISIIFPRKSSARSNA